MWVFFNVLNIKYYNGKLEFLLQSEKLLPFYKTF